MALIVTFAGEYDLACKDALRQDLSFAVDHDVAILDFSDVTYVDSSSLAELVLLARRRIELRFEPALLVLPAGCVKRTIETVHVDALFAVFPTLADAVEARGGRYERRIARRGGVDLEAGDVNYGGSAGTMHPWRAGMISPFTNYR